MKTRLGDAKKDVDRLKDAGLDEENDLIGKLEAVAELLTDVDNGVCQKAVLLQKVLEAAKVFDDDVSGITATLQSLHARVTSLAPATNQDASIVQHQLFEIQVD